MERLSVKMPLPIQFLVHLLIGGVTRQQAEVIEYLKVENLALRGSSEASGFAWHRGQFKCDESDSYGCPRAFDGRARGGRPRVTARIRGHSSARVTA